MKKLMATICLLLATQRPALAQAAKGHDLTVEVTDVKGTGGDLVISLYSKSDGFPDNPAKAMKSVKVSPAKPMHVFKGLAAGKYVVVVFHDKNKDGKVGKSVFGFPTEPIGLSNHPSIGPKGGRPDFEKAKVDVSKDAKVKVNLIEVGR